MGPGKKAAKFQVGMENMIVAVTCADERYRKAMEYNARAAVKKGGADRVYQYSVSDIDPEFRKKNEHILSQPRGNGYWLWKPYFIARTLRLLREGDYLVYCDAGIYYNASVKKLIDAMERQGDDMMAFAINHMEYEYTKRDVFLALDADREEYARTPQRMAGTIVLKKTAHSARVIEEWLTLAQQDDLITDAPNHLGKDNYEGFRDHRHDQSVWSLLSKKENVRAYRDATQFGLPCGLCPWLWKNRKLYRGTESDYPVIFILHRMYEVTWKVRFEIRMQYIFPKGYAVYRKFIKPSIF